MLCPQRVRVAVVHEDSRNLQSLEPGRAEENSSARTAFTRTVAKGRMNRKSFPLYGYAGLGVIIAAEALLFGGNPFVGHWMEPIVWTGYILFVGAMVYRFDGRSLLRS